MLSVWLPGEVVTFQRSLGGIQIYIVQRTESGLRVRGGFLWLFFWGRETEFTRGLRAYEEPCLRTHLPYVVMDVSKSGYSIIKIILIIEVRVFFPDLCIFHVSSAIL